MSYKSIQLQQSITIDEIVSIHYFEYASNFTFPGESHDFWEFLCVDRGEVDVIADDKRLTLHKGDIIFHKPNEFHNVITNGRTAPNLVVISFRCNSEYMKAFENRQMILHNPEQTLLAQIIREARHAFSDKLDNPYLEELIRRPGSRSFGTEQLIRCYLEQFMILLYRKLYPVDSAVPKPQITPKRSGNEAYARIHTYLEQNVTNQLSIEKICKDNLIGRSQLQKLFQERHQCGVIDYFCRLKIEAAKQLIRDNQMNFSQISDKLGYGSIHYFSRQFKKLTGMTPSEYASSIKSLSEKNVHS